MQFQTRDMSGAFRRAAAGMTLVLSTAAWSHAAAETGHSHAAAQAPEQAQSFQSPVDLRATEIGNASPLTVEYAPAIVTAVNDGKTLRIDYPPGSAMTVNGKSYALQQCHFHAPSEHTIEGKRYDMEMHCVHKNETGEIAVLGIMVEKGEKNAGLTPVWNRLSEAKEKGEAFAASINTGKILPPESAHYQTEGSLTTPPYTGGIHWFVLDKPITLSPAQIEAYTSLFQENARPLQNPNGRSIRWNHSHGHSR
jgi:carbonic anhydrase